jgi:hypothetical protein
MLVFTLSKEMAERFLKGEAQTVKIDGAPRQLTYDAAASTVTYDNDDGRQVRKLLGRDEAGSVIRFACAGADGSGKVFVD